MQKNENPSAPECWIKKDNMRLAVTSFRPVFRKKSELEARQEISAKLYQIFKMHEDSMKGEMQNV